MFGPRRISVLYCYGFLEKWEFSHSVRERKLSGKAGEVPEHTVSASMETLLKLTRDYEPADIWNMVETGCFFKALPGKGLADKKSQARGSKRSKTRLAIAFFVNAAEEKVIELLVKWKSTEPRCFKNVKNSERPHGNYYYSTSEKG